VKGAIKATTDELREEIDSLQQTTAARFYEMTNAMNQQRTMIQEVSLHTNSPLKMRTLPRVR